MSRLGARLGTLRGSDRREPSPGIEQLAELAEHITAHGLPVELRVVGEVGALPAVAGNTAYRVVQEALTNTLRHAYATRATVTVAADAAALTLEIADDGLGALPSHPAAEHGGH